MIDTRYTTTTPVLRLPPVQALAGDGWIIGTVSIAHPALRRRYTLASHTFEVDGTLVTSRDIARWWVKQYYDLARLRRRALPPQWEWAPVPHWARAGEYEEAFYVDIRGLHREIIARVGYDVEYAGVGSYLSLNPIAIYLPKPAYLSLSSLSISPKLLLRKWVKKRIVVVEAYNRYANTSLYRLIRDVQRAIAEDVLGEVRDVVYYNTDGAIVTSVYGVDQMIDVVASWGMNARIKREGRARVAGVGAYTFDHSSLPHRRALPHLTKWETVFTATERAWLRARFVAAQQLAARQTVDLSYLEPVGDTHRRDVEAHLPAAAG